MKEMLSKKTVGYYLTAAAAVAGVISAIRFALWAPSHNAMDVVIVIGLIAGIIIDVLLFIKDNEFLMVISTVCYSVALFKMLTDSVGSFVDSYQGINMFGDATQVGTILSISAVMSVSVALSIIAAFMKRVKE